jgi:hypothetical protein
MRRFHIPLALMVVLAVMAMTAATAVAHNAGCVRTGTDDWVFVGSNKDSPTVSSNNPNSRPRADTSGEYQLDLQPGSGDQYGARFAVEQESAVQHPDNCLPREASLP